MRYWITGLVATVVAVAPAASAQTTLPLLCVVQRKVDVERTYSQADLDRFQFHVEIMLEGGALTLRRCSFAPSRGRTTCDDYPVDHVENDATSGIRKFYHYRGQFDVQVFPNGTFVENNGRGSIAFGSCEPR